jgi:hypothetical protein
MSAKKKPFNVLDSIKRHIETLKPLLPKQATVYIGEYPIKALLKQPYIDKSGLTLQVLLGKSSDEIYTWIPKGFNPHLVLGFEDANIQTHFWYNVYPYTTQDKTLIDGLKKKPTAKLHSAILVASLWEGIGSGALPSLISQFKASNMDTLSVTFLPSKIQPSDAYFNTLASVGMCADNDAATLLLLDRDLIENYEGVDRSGSPIKGNAVANYLVNLFLSKETLVQELSEQSRIFNNKMYTVLLAPGASMKIYGSMENIFDATLLKPLLNFDLSSVSLLYVLIRMPESLRDAYPRAKFELAVATWFKDKAKLKSISITEPVYVDDSNDRIDVVLFAGGFDTTEMFLEYEKKTRGLRSRAVQKGLVDKKEWLGMMKSLGLKKDEESGLADFSS